MCCVDGDFNDLGKSEISYGKRSKTMKLFLSSLMEKRKQNRLSGSASLFLDAVLKCSIKNLHQEIKFRNNLLRQQRIGSFKPSKRTRYEYEVGARDKNLDFVETDNFFEKLKSSKAGTCSYRPEPKRLKFVPSISSAQNPEKNDYDKVKGASTKGIIFSEDLDINELVENFIETGSVCGNFEVNDKIEVEQVVCL